MEALIWILFPFKHLTVVIFLFSFFVPYSLTSWDQHFIFFGVVDCRFNKTAQVVLFSGR